MTPTPSAPTPRNNGRAYGVSGVRAIETAARRATAAKNACARTGQPTGRLRTSLTGPPGPVGRRTPVMLLGRSPVLRRARGAGDSRALAPGRVWRRDRG